nr:hypothetical protein [uncultured Acetatifactor sp.]
MSKRKKILIGSITAACVLLLAAGVALAGILLSRGEKREEIAPAENTYEMDYHSYCTYEHDADIDIDGVLDESCWQGKKWYTNTYLDNVNGNRPVVRLTAFPTEKGVYIGSVVEDTNLMDNGERAPLANSNWELRVTADNVGQERGNSAVYLTSYNIDMKGENFGIQPNFDRAVKVVGELNSGDTTSATLEMFIPWESLGIDTSLGVPESFRIRPSYRAALPGMGGNWPLNLTAGDAQTKDFYTFSSEGYVNADREGAALGDSVVGFAKSANWDLSREAEGIVQSSPGEEWHMIYFTGEYGADYIVETKVTYVKPLNNDWPKAGIMFRGTDSTWYDVAMNLNANVVSEDSDGRRSVDILEVGTVDHEWNWRSLTEFNTPNPNPYGPIKLTVLKYGKNFFYFVNDNYITSEVIASMDKEVLPALMALGADAVFEDYSCRELTEEMLRTYLNEKGLCTVTISADNAGGEVKTDVLAVEKGGSYNVSLISKSGYEVSSILVNGEERIQDARQRSAGGVYAVGDVTENQDVHVSFAGYEGGGLSGTISDGTESVSAFLSFKDKGNGTRYYETTGTGQYSIVLPDGTYEVFVLAAGYRTQVFDAKVQGDTVQDILCTASAFPAEVKLGDINMQWGRGNWNLSEEHLNRVSTSFASGGKMVPLYFEETAVDFVVESHMEYTTEFTADESAYQPDLMGGFIFGTGEKNGWVVARTNGIVYTDWRYEGGLSGYDALAYPTKRPITVTLAKEGKNAYLYFDGKLSYQADWEALTGGIGPEEEMAIGLVMVADRTAEITFTNYSLRTGTEAAKQYIASHGMQDNPLEENPMFAESRTVGGQRRVANLGAWDLSQAADGVFMTSLERGGRGNPLYFWEHGSTALISARIEYTTEFTGSESDYQPDLMGGFWFGDGETEGNIWANGTGIVYTGWQYKMGMFPAEVLRYPTKVPVQMTVAVEGSFIYVYFDDMMIAKLPKYMVVPSASADSDLMFGLYMHTDKTADIRFSNISISTDPAAVSGYIDQHK